MITFLRRLYRPFARYVDRLQDEDRIYRERHIDPDAHYLRALGNVIRQEANERDGQRREAPPAH